MDGARARVADGQRRVRRGRSGTPAREPSGLAGFHASWHGQSGYMSLCPGATAVATVAYSNSGSRGWVAGRLGEVAYLGTSDPDPGQDRASILGGDGTLMNIATNTAVGGPDTSFWAGAGTYFLKVNSSGGDWKLDVQDYR